MDNGNDYELTSRPEASRDTPMIGQNAKGPETAAELSRESNPGGWLGASSRFGPLRRARPGIESLVARFPKIIPRLDWFGAIVVLLVMAWLDGQTVFHC